MFASLTAAWNRGFAVLGRVSMYRLVFGSLCVLGVIALVLSLARVSDPQWYELLASAAVLALVCVGVDTAAQRLLRLPARIESSLITAGILLFVLRPTVAPLGLVGLAIAAAIASASKYLLAWRGRHIFNPAAVGATVLTLITAVSGQYALGTSSWWIGSPLFGPIVLLLAIVVVWRTERLGVIGLFWLVALVAGTVATTIQYQVAGSPVGLGTVVWQVLWSSPLLFLGGFMLAEPLTMPPRRWQQLLVATLVGVLVGWAPFLGDAVVSLGQERALLIGNLLAFAFAARTAVRLVFVSRSAPTPTVRELTFHAPAGLHFSAGQYLELDVPHRRPDARGTRRPFSIASAPEDLPEVRIAFREGPSSPSSFKRALAAVAPGDSLAVTGIWGDFVLPKHPHAPILLVAAGVGVTPFVSQLRHLAATGQRRDIVVVYVASTAAELAFLDDLRSPGVRVVAFTRDEPQGLDDDVTWAGGMRVSADALERVVPDLAERHAYASGPAGLIADLAPALEKARSITTDAFSGY